MEGGDDNTNWAADGIWVLDDNGWKFSSDGWSGKS